ncbi:hypothetical protein A6770_39605 [Nostoc minutum NIES-26]|uniref:DUF6745 domain-containing protein n=1 Tax=Nostoc minutum NIES-26 TaxID=1844469 RepID=A0A367RQ22_9NOSO|nr:hypothetical protein A6770_39605 [Nostoc minutum NIES-26]
MIEILTPEQKALVPLYQEKWRKIALSTGRIDREKAAKAVRNAYAVIKKTKPKIIFSDDANSSLQIFFNSIYLPHLLNYTLMNTERKQFNKVLGNPISGELHNEIIRQFNEYFSKQIDSKIDRYIHRHLVTIPSTIRMLPEPNIHFHTRLLYNCVNPKEWERLASKYDFLISVLNCIYPPKVWNAFSELITECGWIFPFEKLCLICDYPLEFRYDNAYRLHAEGLPAIEIAQGCNIYAYHGVLLPEKYGKLHPDQWQAKWVLEEYNAELRRVLIQGIGYARIIEELQATELDSYQEYTLFKIDSDVDSEPIHLLKMNCPSTGRIHVLRVPPNINSAREAIAWVNWGIDPEDFSVQT